MNFLQQLDVVSILQVGVIGLGFLLALLAFRLLSKEQQLQEPRQRMFRAIYVFMFFSVVLCAVGLGSEGIRRWAPELGDHEVSRISDYQRHKMAVVGVGGRNAPASDGFRVTAYVNGVGYSFPSELVWGEWGHQWSEKAVWPLEDADHYRVQFRLWVKLPNGEIREFGSSEMHEFAADELHEAKLSEYGAGPYIVKYRIE